MSLDLESMLKAILESQERMISRSSTSCERAYEPTTSLEYQPHGDFGQGHQYKYEYEEEEANFSQASNEENIINMLEKLLENQERGKIKMERQLDSLSTKINANGKALSSKLDGVIAHDGFQEEAEDSIHELEVLLGCMADEKLVIRYEEQDEPIASMAYSTRSNDKEVCLVERSLEDLCGDGLIVECMKKTREISLVMDEFSTKEEMHVKLISKKGTRGEESKQNLVIHIEKSPKEVQEEGFPMDKPFDKHLGILSTKKLIVDDLRKVTFEEIRMNEFRGWFYDEYDPGDPSFGKRVFTTWVKSLNTFLLHFSASARLSQWNKSEAKGPLPPNSASNSK
ncbi:hypothetical protein YC2023_019714 [Brassica napus]